MRQKKHDAEGRFLPGVVQGGASAGGKAAAAIKPYSIAAREMLSATTGAKFPESWPKDRKLWTNAQELVERDISRAFAGDEDAAKRIIERAEGKVMSAPEDRESNEKAAANLGAGMALLDQLKQALMAGRRKSVVVDSEIIEQPALPEKT